ncbi:MAG: delta-60 repeat domain-containing protein, partial [Bacteroidota bacterium]
MLRKLRCSALLCLVAWVATAQVIDPNFNPVILQSGAGFQVLAQEDDKILVITNRANSFLNEFAVKPLFRLQADGSLDNSFDFPDEIKDFPFCMALQSDGKILIGGKFYDGASRYLGSVLRLMPNGTIDPDFEILLDASLNVIDLEVLEDQKIFIAAQAEDPNSSNLIYSLHLKAKDGKSDPNFSSIVFPAGGPAIANIASQSATELLVAGSNLTIGNRTQDVFRLDASGVVDTDFSPIIESVSNIKIKNMVVSGDGSIGILSGDDFNTAIFDREGNVLSRYQVGNEFARIEVANDDYFYILGRKCFLINKDGLRISGPETNTFGSRATIQSNNQMVMVGFFSTVNGQFTPGIVRFQTANGFPSFQTDGSFQAGLYTRGLVRDVLVQEDGKIIIVGKFQRVNDKAISQIARLLPNGQVDDSFNDNLGHVDQEAGKILQLPSGELLIGAQRQGSIFEGKILGLTITNKDGYQAAPVPFPYVAGSSGGNIAYMDMDTKGQVYAGESTAFYINGESSQKLQKYTDFGANLSATDYDATYIDGLVRFSDLTLQKDDKLLLFGAGLRYDGSDSTFVVRALESGERDPSFFINTSGKMSAFAGHATDDNNIFVGGTDYTDTEPEVFLYKLSEDGQIDRDLSSKIERGNLNFPRVQLIEGLPEDKILLHGVFSEYDGNPV